MASLCVLEVEYDDLQLGIAKSVDIVQAPLYVSVPQYIVHERAFWAGSFGRRSLQCNTYAGR